MYVCRRVGGWVGMCVCVYVSKPILLYTEPELEWKWGNITKSQGQQQGRAERSILQPEDQQKVQQRCVL